MKDSLYAVLQNNSSGVFRQLLMFIEGTYTHKGTRILQMSHLISNLHPKLVLIFVKMPLIRAFKFMFT